MITTADIAIPSEVRPLSVLLVDDDEDVHEVLDEIIDGEHLECVLQHAYNGEEALDIMRLSCPDLLILDIRMPVMDGMALREEMLHDPQMTNVELAVFTGHSMSNTELQVLLADYYLPKPVRLDALLKVLNQAHQNLATVTQRTLKRQEATVRRLDTVIRDLQQLRSDLFDKLKKH